jgi:ABC-type antimicrobial peptide transport system permease subunit
MSGPLPLIRDTLQQIEPTLPVELTTMAASRRQLTAQSMFYAVLLGGFAAVALVLAGLGVYSSMAYLVVQRTREIGIRLALGATSAGVVRHFLWRFGGSVIAGVAGGILGTWLLAGALRGLLYGVAPRDPVTLLLLALVLPMVALTACAVPAWRVARRPPIAALQAE